MTNPAAAMAVPVGPPPRAKRMNNVADSGPAGSTKSTASPLPDPAPRPVADPAPGPAPEIPSATASSRYLAFMTVGALGVVYGDIGTSPLYAFQQCFAGSSSLPVSRENVLGILSLMFWSLILIVSIKYLGVVMRASNKGEGGILALLSLAFPDRSSKLGRSRVLLISLGRGGGLRIDGYALIILGAAVLQALYSMAQRPLLARYSGLQVVTYGVIFAALCFVPWAGPSLAQFARAGNGPRFCVLFLGVVPTAVGYWTWADANRHLPVSVAGSFLYLIPPVALLMGWAALGEAPTALSLGGGALVVGGVAMVQKLGRRSS